ncbi:MAG: NAD(P)/FAD-dependent oxidoreductase [Gammaproteobacteria bacterium]|nr:NAD(P)/FAD-dependent oxidoreductase [Gammaproteobacteria bacterium]
MGSRVGIIGAGFAGLSTAKVFKTFGLNVTVMEKEPDVGGVWSASRRYPGLTTQNPRTTYELSDYPMPSSYPEWPSGEQVQAYLQSYAEHFSFDHDIMLNTTVTRAQFDNVTETWTLAIEQASGEATQLVFDRLIVCNGIFSIPFIPDYRGVDAFTGAGGRICHTSEFTNIDDAIDKHVVIVGYGKSSCDVANATVATSASTTVLARNLIWKIPKKLKNIVNFKYLFLTRLGEGLFRYIRLRGFDKFLHGVGLPIRNALLGSVESVVEKQLHLREIGLHPEKPLETIARSTVSLVTEGFYENVADGNLSVRKHTQIAELRAGEVVLSTGEVIPADVIICGTGWKQLVPFFDAQTTSRITDAQGNFRLYRSMLPLDVPALAFNGYNSSFFSQLSAEIGALWLIEYFSGNISLPADSHMRADIDARLAWMEQRTDGKHSKGTNIIPFSVHQIDEFLGDINLPLGALKRFSQWFMPVVGPDYRSLTKRLLARHQAASNKQSGAM